MLTNKYDAVSLADDEDLNHELRKVGKQETEKNREILRGFAAIVEANEGQDFITDEQLQNYIKEHGNLLE